MESKKKSQKTKDADLISEEEKGFMEMIGEIVYESLINKITAGTDQKDLHNNKNTNK